MHINHISKLEFLYAFCEAFFASMTEKNNVTCMDPGRVWIRARVLACIHFDCQPQ
jgi:hypothetical protein